MTVAATNLTTGTDSDGGSSSTTSSISPSANALLLLTVVTRTNITANPNTPSITGNGLTWALVNSALFDSTSASRKKVFLFRSMGQGPSAGTVTIDFSGQAQTDTLWSIDEFTGVNRSGNSGSGAIVQSAVAVDESVTTPTLSIALGAFSSANNATFGGMGSDGISPSVSSYGTGFTGLATQTTSNMGVASEFRNDNSTSVGITWNANHMLGGVAVEIAAGGDVTIALTGIAATASPGSIAKTSLFTVPLIGIGATAAAGTLGKSSLIARGISGAAATVAAGSIAPARSFGIAGIAATASPGSIAKTSLFTVPLTGIGATAAAGSVAYSAGSDLTLSLSGNAATAAAGTLGKSSLITIGLSGAAATAVAGNVVPGRSVGISGNAGTASPGTFAKTNLFTVSLVGNAATTSPGNVVDTGDKTVAIIGTAMTAMAGSIAVAGADFWHPVIPGAATWMPQASASGTWTPQASAPGTWTPQ